MYKSGCSLSFRFDFMAGLLKKGRYADEVMQVLDGEERKRFAKVGRNDPCPCGEVDGDKN